MFYLSIRIKISHCLELTMTGKIIFILTVVTILNGADAFKQLNANIDKMIARIENKTKGLMEDGKAIVLYNRTTSNDNGTHSYMIQKEREKLSIIPMIPIGIKNINKPIVDEKIDRENVNDSEYEDIYESEEEKDKGGWKPIRLDENDTDDKKDEIKSTAMTPTETTTTTITTTTKKPCSCGKLIKGLN